MLGIGEKLPDFTVTGVKPKFMEHEQGGESAFEDIILLEDGHCLRDHALSICRLKTGDGAGQVAATSLGTLVNMVAGGLGVSLLPRLATENGLMVGNDVAVRPFTSPVIGRQIGIAWRQGSPREADARKIGEILKTALTPGETD